MSRYLIQSQRTGKFLVRCPVTDEPTWERNLALAGSGVFDEIEYASQLIEDWTEQADLPVVVDLDNIIDLVLASSGEASP